MFYLALAGLCSVYSTNIEAVIAFHIADYQPSFNIDVTKGKIPDIVVLADPNIYRPQRVDLRIGASLFFDHLSVGEIKFFHCLHIAQKTRFGWEVSVWC